MTPKQFFIIRNLLSWIVIALFLIVAQQYTETPRSDLTEFIIGASMIIVFVFLISIFFRMLFFVDPKEKEKSREEEPYK